MADDQPSAVLGVVGSTLGNALQQVLTAKDIEPGDQPGYETCKAIYLYHPFGAKIVEKPVKMAQSQPRNIAIPKGPEDRLREAFLETWEKIAADKRIFMTRVLAKVYGISAIALMEEKVEVEKPLDLKTLHKRKFTFNLFDPLNVAGSLVLNQDPMAFDFQHAQEIRVSGNTFHKSRSRVVMNEFPIYISYTPSTFGFSGRSCYQRALFPLKSFVQTMQTNDMVSLKAAVIVEKIKQPSSIINQAMRLANAMRRSLVKQAKIGNVVSIGLEDMIESIDLKNLSEPFMSARKNIIQDIASGVPMPARLLTEESYAEGFGEGSEDAKDIARFVKEEREQMAPLYEFFDEITMHLAWTPDFYEIIQKDFEKEYGGVDYEAAFYQWKNSFKATWPNLLEEPDSEKVKVDDIKLRALLSILMALMPRLPPEELAKVIEWVCDNINDMKLLFGSPLNLNYDEIAKQQPEPGFGEEGDEKGGAPMKAMSYATDSVRAIDELRAAVARLPERRKLTAVR